MDNTKIIAGIGLFIGVGLVGTAGYLTLQKMSAQPKQQATALHTTETLIAEQSQTEPFKSASKKDQNTALRIAKATGEIAERNTVIPADMVPETCENKGETGKRIGHMCVIGTTTAVFINGAQFNLLPSIADQPNIRTISIGNLKAPSLEILTRFPALEKLIVVQSKIDDLSDLDPLFGLTELRQLSLFDTQVADLSPLAALTKLEQLYADETRVTDLSPLSALERLRPL